MKLINLTVESWNRFTTRNLAVETDLLGQFHEFLFDDHRVRVQLPSEDSLPKGSRRGNKLSYNSFREVDGREIPTKFWIHQVDVTVLVDENVRIPEEILSVPNNAYDLLSASKKAFLEKLAQKYEMIAEGAFNRWLRVMRWKCDDSSIGRPEILGSETGWATCLRDDVTKKDIWAVPRPSLIELKDPITVERWNAVESALKNGSRPLVYYDFMFDGIEHLNNGDLQRAVLDFAVACECCIRKSIMSSLPVNWNNIREYIDKAPIRTAINVLPEVLSNEKERAIDKLQPILHQLFDDRNDIMHSGMAEELSLEKCEKYRGVVQKLIHVIDN